jgi:hypothetical protein
MSITQIFLSKGSTFLFRTVLPTLPPSYSWGAIVWFSWAPSNIPGYLNIRLVWGLVCCASEGRRKPRTSQTDTSAFLDYLAFPMRLGWRNSWGIQKAHAGHLWTWHVLSASNLSFNVSSLLLLFECFVGWEHSVEPRQECTSTVGSQRAFSSILALCQLFYRPSSKETELEKLLEAPCPWPVISSAPPLEKALQTFCCTRATFPLLSLHSPRFSLLALPCFGVLIPTYTWLQSHSGPASQYSSCPSSKFS